MESEEHCGWPLLIISVDCDGVLYYEFILPDHTVN